MRLEPEQPFVQLVVELLDAPLQPGPLDGEAEVPDAKPEQSIVGVAGPRKHSVQVQVQVQGRAFCGADFTPKPDRQTGPRWGSQSLTLGLGLGLGLCPFSECDPSGLDRDIALTSVQGPFSIVQRVRTPVGQLARGGPRIARRPFFCWVPDSLFDLSWRDSTNNDRRMVRHYRTPTSTISWSGNVSYHRHREVVQRSEGFWFHHPRERTEGLLRTLLGHPVAGLPLARRGRSG